MVTFVTWDGKTWERDPLSRDDWIWAILGAILDRRQCDQLHIALQLLTPLYKVLNLLALPQVHGTNSVEVLQVVNLSLTRL